jgi:5'-phosphate synthase pdxT subunit
MVFIRGPVIERAGPRVKVLAEYAGRPTLVQRENIMAATFHPELTEDTTVHEYFLGIADARAKKPANGVKSSS